MNGVVPVLPQLKIKEEDELRSFVYNVGFLHAAWADTVLSISNLPVLRLHALFVSQSPVLYHHLSTQTSQNGYHISLESNDPGLSAPAVSTALATLYGHPMDIQSCDLPTARGLLAAGCLFGLEKVASSAYDLLLQCIAVENLKDFFQLALSPSLIAGDKSENQGPYPPYTNGLVDTLVEFVLQNLDASQPLSEPWTQVFKVLPFELNKSIIENESLRVANAMDRHTFAKNVIRLRNKAGFPDEHVVMAFGGGKNGIEVAKRRRKAKSKQ